MRNVSVQDEQLACSRRGVLKLVAGTCASILIGCETDHGSGLVEIEEQNDLPDTAASPSLLGLSKGMSSPLDLEFTPYEGTLPDSLGYAFIMGPNPWGDGTPIFNGDGTILRIHTEGGALRLKSRRIITPCARLDEAARETPFAYKNRAFIRESNAFGTRNFLNTSPVPTFDGRLMVTYDAGRPWEISPDELKLTTPIGTLDQWRPMLPPLTHAQRFNTQSMSTAHPAYDEFTREVYSVNFAPAVEGVNIEPFFDLLWWGDDGKIKRAPLVNEEGSPCVLQMSCHQIQLTERYVILIDSAVLVEPEQLFGIDVTRPQLPVTPLWVVSREQLADGVPAVAQHFVVDSEAAHFLAAYNDHQGIDLILVHQCSSDPSEWIRADDTLAHNGERVNPSYVGLPVAGADRLWLGRYSIDLDAKEMRLKSSIHGDEMWGLTLWTQDPRRDTDHLGCGWWISQGWHPDLFTTRIAETYKDQAHRTIDFSEMPDHAQACRLLKIDHESMEITHKYQFDEGYIPLSPTYLPVAEEAGSMNGVILTLIQGPDGCELWFFDADQVEDGPIAKCAHSELCFGHTLHSAWLSAITPPPSSYMISAVDELRARFEFLSPDAQIIAETALNLI